MKPIIYCRIADLTGKKFNKLTVIGFAYVKNNKSVWYCKCDCGKTTLSTAGNLSSGQAKSCGCTRKESLISRNTKHGLVNHRLHVVWVDMRRRCYNETDIQFKDYGGRGIRVCQAWKNDFKPFYDWAMSNGWKDGLTIERVNNNGNYEPSNCRWATRLEQNRNQRSNRNLTYKSKTLCISEWAQIAGISASTIYSRINRGWSTEDALTLKPVTYKNRTYERILFI